MSQPFACHPHPIAHRIQPSVIDGCLWLDVQQQHRFPHALHQREHSGGQGVGGDEDADQFHLLAREEGGRRKRLRLVVHHTATNHLYAHLADVGGNLTLIALQTRQEPFVLSPVRVKSDAE